MEKIFLRESQIFSRIWNEDDVKNIIKYKNEKKEGNRPELDEIDDKKIKIEEYLDLFKKFASLFKQEEIDKIRNDKKNLIKYFYLREVIIEKYISDRYKLNDNKRHLNLKIADYLLRIQFEENEEIKENSKLINKLISEVNKSYFKKENLDDLSDETYINKLKIVLGTKTIPHFLLRIGYRIRREIAKNKEEFLKNAEAEKELDDKNTIDTDKEDEFLSDNEDYINKEKNGQYIIDKIQLKNNPEQKPNYQQGNNHQNQIINNYVKKPSYQMNNNQFNNNNLIQKNSQGQIGNNNQNQFNSKVINYPEQKIIQKKKSNLNNQNQYINQNNLINQKQLNNQNQFNTQTQFNNQNQNNNQFNNEAQHYYYQNQNLTHQQNKYNQIKNYPTQTPIYQIKNNKDQSKNYLQQKIQAQKINYQNLFNNQQMQNQIHQQNSNQPEVNKKYNKSKTFQIPSSKPLKDKRAFQDKQFSYLNNLPERKPSVPIYNEN